MQKLVSDTKKKDRKQLENFGPSPCPGKQKIPSSSASPGKNQNCGPGTGTTSQIPNHKEAFQCVPFYESFKCSRLFD